MRLPEVIGHEYLALIEDDPFGWSFVSRTKEGKRLVRVLKAQATNDDFARQFLEPFSTDSVVDDGGTKRPESAIEVSHLQIGNENSPTYFTTPFYGWKSKESGNWQSTSLKRLMHLTGLFFQGEQASELIEELAQAIQLIHREEIFHGGLRPSGIYVTNGHDGDRQIKIGDFGQIFMGGLQYLEGGEQLFYMSPEQMGTGDFSDDTGLLWDVYSFGVIAFQILTGHLPRLDRHRQHLLQNPEVFRSSPAISYGELTELTKSLLNRLEAEKPVEWPDKTPDRKEKRLREIIQNCLWFDPERRAASIDTVVDQLSDLLRTPAVTTRLPAKKSKPKAKPVAKPVKPAPVADDPTPTKKADIPPEPIMAVPAEAAMEPASDLGSSDLSEPVLPPDSAVPNGESVRDRTTSFFQHHPALKWQIATGVCAAALVFLGISTLVFFVPKSELSETKTEVEAELQANIEQQASAYRKQLDAKQRSSEQMRSELNEIADSNSRLLGEAKLARQLVRQTQENGDEFFRLVLENRDTDVPGFREQRADSLNEARKHYERLIEVYGDAPDFIVSTANAYFYLGRIYREIGEFGKSLASFGETERRYMALLDDTDSPNAEFVRNLAIAKKCLGDLSLKNAKFAIARHYYTESSRYWAETRSVSDIYSQEPALSIHENSLAIVECELAINRPEAALDGARSIGAGLLKLQEQDPENDRILGALAKSFSLVARILETQGDGETAVEAYEQSSNLYAKAVKLNAAIDAHHLGLGNSLARVGFLKNDHDKLKAAVEVLSDVVATNPFESAYQITLANVFGTLARNQRDGGHPNNAIKLEQEAISILQPIIRKNPAAAPNDLLFSYSGRLAHLAELLGDAGDFDDSRAPLGESIRVLEKICQSEEARPKHRRALARSRGLAGFACLKTGNKNEAKEHLELAKAQWESFVAENPRDSDAEQAVRWTNDQLRGLQ
jgi:serine/threonine protein kinase